MEKDKRQFVVAYKWLAELHGVLCTDTRKQSEIQNHQINIKKALTEIIKLQNYKNLNDDHLKFLFYKKVCNVSKCNLTISIAIINIIIFHFLFLFGTFLFFLCIILF